MSMAQVIDTRCASAATVLRDMLGDPNETKRVKLIARQASSVFAAFHANRSLQHVVVV